MRAWHPLACLILATWLSCLTAPTSAQSPVNGVLFGMVRACADSAAANTAGAGYSLIILRGEAIQPAGIDDWKPTKVPDPFIVAELTARRETSAVLAATRSRAASTPGSANSRAVAKLAIGASATASSDALDTPGPTPTPSPVTSEPTYAHSSRLSPTPLPPVTPLSILTTSRCLILLLVGLAVFTFTYGLQVAVWRRRH